MHGSVLFLGNRSVLLRNLGLFLTSLYGKVAEERAKTAHDETHKISNLKVPTFRSGNQSINACDMAANSTG